MLQISGANGLVGHVSPNYLQNRVRDTENAKVFLQEFDEYEKNFDSKDPEKRLPNYIVMSMQENHTHGTDPKSFTPRAMVANQDYALGQMLERLTHSRYWPQMAIFIMEDDAQDGPDHVDARRTACLVISPYIKRGIVDSTLYTTSSMVRSIELLLGMPPLSQYDAAATPFYAAFGRGYYAHCQPGVELIHIPLLKHDGEVAVHVLVLCKAYHTAGFAIQPVHWVHPLPEQVANPRHRELIVIGPAAMHRQAGRLAHRHHVGVAIENLDVSHRQYQARGQLEELQMRRGGLAKLRARHKS